MKKEMNLQNSTSPLRAESCGFLPSCSGDENSAALNRAVENAGNVKKSSEKANGRSPNKNRVIPRKAFGNVL